MRSGTRRDIVRDNDLEVYTQRLKRLRGELEEASAHLANALLNARKLGRGTLAIETALGETAIAFNSVRQALGEQVTL